MKNKTDFPPNFFLLSPTAKVRTEAENKWHLAFIDYSHPQRLGFILYNISFFFMEWLTSFKLSDHMNTGTKVLIYFPHVLTGSFKIKQILMLRLKIPGYNAQRRY